MDSPIALALMTKAQAVFGAADTFLSFPIVPLPFTKKRLSFIAEGLTSGESLEGAVEFSCLVNLIPQGPVWTPEPGSYLWDIYRDVLESVAPVDLAKSSRSPQEEQEYQDACAFLHIVHDDATWEDTPQVKVYNQYRVQSFALLQEYNSHRSEAELSTDPRIKEQWQTIDEPAMQGEMQALSNEWAANGYKAEVEVARSTYARLGAKWPRQIWAQWHDQMLPFIDTITAPGSGEQVFVTGFSPSDAIEATAWQRFTLRGDEIAALMSQVPDELKKRLAPGSVPLDVETLSFEYSSVSVIRSWLETDLFKSRFWRFHDTVEPLSDGQMPPHGRCPAYVAAVVFARNVNIRLKERVLPNDEAASRLKSEEGLSLGVLRLTKSPMLARLRHPILQRIGLERGDGIVRRNAPVSASTGAPARPSPRLSPRPSTRPNDDVTGASSSTSASAGPSYHVDAVRAMRAISLLQGKDFSRLTNLPRRPTLAGAIGPLSATSATATTASAASPASADTPSRGAFPQRETPEAASLDRQSDTLDDTIYVMAFICKRLPRCPDPDPNLQW